MGQINTITGAAGPWIFVLPIGYPISKIDHGQSKTAKANKARPRLPRCLAHPMIAMQQHNAPNAPTTKIAPSYSVRSNLKSVPTSTYPNATQRDTRTALERVTGFQRLDLFAEAGMEGFYAKA